MLRTVTSHLELDIRGSTNMVFSMTAAQGSAVTSETLSFVLDGEPQKATELTDRHGTRLHQFAAGPGFMVVDYTADIAGRSDPASVVDLDLDERRRHRPSLAAATSSRTPSPGRAGPR